MGPRARSKVPAGMPRPKKTRCEEQVGLGELRLPTLKNAKKRPLAVYIKLHGQAALVVSGLLVGPSLLPASFLSCRASVPVLFFVAACFGRLISGFSPCFFFKNYLLHFC